WATERVPFYAERLRGRAVRGLGELATLPFTRKSDLREHYPFGLFAVPRAELARLHASSGTKGKPTVVGYTAGDLDIWREVMARLMVAAGARPGHMLHVAYDIYGLSEIIGPGVAGECVARDGLHVMDDHFLPEIIDPVTGAPRAEGERGELVLTTLTKRALPMLRYRTGDITALTTAPCRCGRTSARIARLTGRADDM